jgi:hypothetical protein
MTSFTIYVCPECGAIADSWLVTHTALCENTAEVQEVEVVPRAVADELATGLEWYERRAHVAARSVAGQALAKYREAVGDG